MSVSAHLNVLLRAMRIAIVAVAGFLFLPNSSHAALSSQSIEYLEEAQQSLQDGDIAAAIIQLKNAIREDADNSEARFTLALLYLQSGDPEAAERELKSAEGRGFDANRLILPLAQAYFAQGKYDLILNRINPDDFEGDIKAGILVSQARSQIAQRDPEEAIFLIDQALDISPNLASALAAKSIVRRLELNIEEATSLIEQALEQAPNQVEYLVLKGELVVQGGAPDDALSAFDQAIEINPVYSRARISRAMANLALGNLDEMAMDVTAVITREPTNPLALYLQAVLFSRKGEYVDAISLLQPLSELLQTYLPAKYLLAASLYANNQFEQALLHAEQYNSRAPEDPVGAKLRAAIEFRLNNPIAAVEILEPLIEQYPDDQQAKLQLATAYVATGQSVEAEELFQIFR